MYYVYVLESLVTKRHYIGCTSHLERRLKEHQSRLSRYTKNRGPWKLIYSESKRTLAEAEKREKFLKSGDGRKTLKILLNQKAS